MNSIDQELIEAARENNVPEVCQLLRAGADTEAKDRVNGWTALHRASYHGHLQVFQALREHGADIKAKDSSGWTPLHCTCCFGQLAVIIELLGHGADIDMKDNAGYTPLHYASSGGHVAIVQALLSRGANILATNEAGHLPIHYALSEGHSAVSKCLLQQLYATTRRLPLHELFEDLTWIVNPGVNDVLPPLRYALDQDVLDTDNVVEILEYVVGQNAEMLKSRDQDGSSPLHVACRRGASFSIVQSLVNLYKASAKSVTSQGDLPIFLACEIPEPSLDTIFLLMKLYPDLVYR
jgi:ankyrin repeat protein